MSSAGTLLDARPDDEEPCRYRRRTHRGRVEPVVRRCRFRSGSGLIAPVESTQLTPVGVEEVQQRTGALERGRREPSRPR